MKNPGIKICGLRDAENISAISRLEPDYMGFILYPGSPRFINLNEAILLARNIPATVQTVGVLVNETLENAIKMAGSGAFNLIQLHGNETPEYCRKLHNHIDLVKAFHITDAFPDNISDYEPFCKMFILDTAGEKHGGSGKKFDHGILSTYPSETEFLLGGGIGPEDHSYLRSLNIKHMAGADLNSRFEIKPGLKDISLLKTFIENLRK